MNLLSIIFAGLAVSSTAKEGAIRGGLFNTPQTSKLIKAEEDGIANQWIVVYKDNIEEEAIEQEQAARSAEVREEQRARESAKEEGCERERVLAKGRVAARDCLQARVILCLRGSGVLCASASARVRVRARISWSSP